jgi:rhomboid protease GluP
MGNPEVILLFLRNERIGQYIRLYPITSCIILINLCVFAAMSLVGSSTDSVTLIQFGAMFRGPDVTPEWWRLFTSMFLHIGITHLIFNMFALYVFAPPLERLLGKGKYAILYVLSGIGGSLASEFLRSGPFLSAGASGAIYGIYGAYLFIALFRKYLFDQQSKQTIVIILVIGLIYSVIVPNIDLYAHGGGLLAGFLISAVVAGRRK